MFIIDHQIPGVGGKFGDHLIGILLAERELALLSGFGKYIFPVPEKQKLLRRCVVCKRHTAAAADGIFFHIDLTFPD